MHEVVVRPSVRTIARPPTGAPGERRPDRVPGAQFRRRLLDTQGGLGQGAFDDRLESEDNASEAAARIRSSPRMTSRRGRRGARGRRQRLAGCRGRVRPPIGAEPAARRCNVARLRSRVALCGARHRRGFRLPRRGSGSGKRVVATMESFSTGATGTSSPRREALPCVSSWRRPVCWIRFRHRGIRTPSCTRRRRSSRATSRRPRPRSRGRCPSSSPPSRSSHRRERVPARLCMELRTPGPTAEWATPSGPLVRRPDIPGLKRPVRSSCRARRKSPGVGPVSICGKVSPRWR